MAKRSKKSSKHKNGVIRRDPVRVKASSDFRDAPALGWQKLDLWPLSRPKDRHIAASATRLGERRIDLIPVEHPDPSTFQRNKPSTLTLAAKEQREVSAHRTRDYPGCKKRPDGNRRRSGGAGSGKKFVPWCS